jgi:hypothetical protein
VLPFASVWLREAVFGSFRLVRGQNGDNFVLQEQDPAIVEQEYWWIEAWKSARPRVVAMTRELIISVWTLLIFSLFYLVGRIFILAGVPKDEVNNVLRIDFWLIYAVFVSFGCLFVMENVVGVLSEMKKLLSSKAQ